MEIETMKLETKIGDIGNEASFKIQFVYFEELSRFNKRIEAIRISEDKEEIIRFYRETMELLEKYEDSEYINELLEICEASIADVSLRNGFDLEDLYLLWSDLRLFYSTAKDVNSLTNDYDVETLDKDEYSNLDIYTCEILDVVDRDENFYDVFAYKVVSKEKNKTVIKLYQLIY